MALIRAETATITRHWSFINVGPRTTKTAIAAFLYPAPGDGHSGWSGDRPESLDSVSPRAEDSGGTHSAEFRQEDRGRFQARGLAVAGRFARCARRETFSTRCLVRCRRCGHRRSLLAVNRLVALPRGTL